MVYAGLWSRLMAHNIDLIILLPGFYVISFFITSNSLLFALCLVLSILYEVLLTSFKGGTIGKRMVKLKVVNKEGKSLTLQHSLLRSMSKLVGSCTFFIGFAIIELNQQKKSLHDMLSRTFVIISSES